MAGIFSKKTTDTFLSNIAWFFIIFGLLLILFSTWNRLLDEVAHVLDKMGFAILTSGVFAAILKSFQFIGIFKKEVEEVILDSKFIEKRNDLTQLWKKISTSVYKQKFPELSDELQETILSSYFPTNHSYYYEDAIISIHIEEFDENENITYTQSSKLKVVLAEDVNEVEMYQSYTLDKIPNMTLNNSERLYYKVDGIDRIEDMDVCESETDYKLLRKHSLKISNKRSFILEFKEQRKY